MNGLPPEHVFDTLFEHLFDVKNNRVQIECATDLDAIRASTILLPKTNIEQMFGWPDSVR